jgi:hypothetical protein
MGEPTVCQNIGWIEVEGTAIKRCLEFDAVCCQKCRSVDHGNIEYQAPPHVPYHQTAQVGLSTSNEEWFDAIWH